MYIPNMKIYFFGTPDFAVPTLKILALSKDFEIQKVVTQPDKPGDRGKITEPPVKIVADSLRLQVIQPEKIDVELIEKIKKDKPDAIVVVAYGELIPPELLTIPKYGCINVHPSLLPKYRGASPIQEALLNGDKETGITIMKIDKELDHGAIFLIKRIPIDQSDTYTSLSEKLAGASAIILPLALNDIEQEILTPLKQDDSKATFCRKISKEDGKIDLEKSGHEIINQIRAFNPWPSTYLNFNNKRLKIFEAKLQKPSKKEIPGKVVILSKESFGIQTKDDLLVPTKIQIEGKSPVLAKEFLNGYMASLEKAKL